MKQYIDFFNYYREENGNGRRFTAWLIDCVLICAFAGAACGLPLWLRVGGAAGIAGAVLGFSVTMYIKFAIINRKNRELRRKALRQATERLVRCRLTAIDAAQLRRLLYEALSGMKFDAIEEHPQYFVVRRGEYRACVGFVRAGFNIPAEIAAFELRCGEIPGLQGQGGRILALVDEASDEEFFYAEHCGVRLVSIPDLLERTKLHGALCSEEEAERILVREIEEKRRKRKETISEIGDGPRLTAYIALSFACFAAGFYLRPYSVYFYSMSVALLVGTAIAFLIGKRRKPAQSEEDPLAFAAPGGGAQG